MGRYFESFAEAWDAFLARDEPLEDFFDELPGGVFDGEAWVIVPPPEIKRAALALQVELEDVDGLTLLPHHFLHVSLTPEAVRGLRGPFDVEYARVNCFHTAVVSEVDAPELRRLDPRPIFLPHLTLAVVTGEPELDSLRDVLVRMRDTALGRQRVDEALRIHVELSRHHLFEPWTVLERLRR